MRDDFAIFVLSHGRSDTSVTPETLQRCGYSGKVFIVIDDEDEQRERYIERYGEQSVLVFCKKDYAAKVDTVSVSGEMKTPLFARNAICDYAKEKCLSFFGMWDDDIDNLLFRYNDAGVLRKKDVVNLDMIFEEMLAFMENTGTDCMAFTNAGGLIGGVKGRFSEGLRRQAAATFIIRTNSFSPFVGVYNEDMNFSLLKAARGQLVFELTSLAFYTCERGNNSGGLHDSYADKNWYYINFHSVVCLPAVCKVTKRKKIETLAINWKCAIPKIISQRWKK